MLTHATGILFHRRAANETVQTWLRCLREGPLPAAIQGLINSRLCSAEIKPDIPSK